MNETDRLKANCSLDCAKETVYLSIVVPLYNEEESVDMLVGRIIKAASSFNFTYELILVDDGSTDCTWVCIERLKEKTPQLRGIKFRRNYGQTSAMVAGFDHSRGDIIITMDGDLQNNPDDIPMLIDKINEGYQIVSGWRKERKDHWSRVFASKVANWIISTITGIHLHDYGCSLKAYQAECIKPIKAYGEMHRFFPVLTSMTGAIITEVPVKHNARKYGASKYGFNRILKVLSDIFSIVLIVKFSGSPLLAFSLCALPFLIFTIFFTLLTVLSTTLSWTEGKDLFFALSAGLSFLGMFQLLALGIISELVVSTSDLSHTMLPQITGEIINCYQDEDNTSF